jgi:hypothetical protein
MSLWAMKYIGQPWTKDCDCGGWFHKIQAEQFGRDVSGILADYVRSPLTAAKLLSGDISDRYGWVPTESPIEGDAAFMSRKSRPHHIGTVLVSGNEIYILHALEGVGVVHSSALELSANIWKIVSFYIPCR